MIIEAFITFRNPVICRSTFGKIVALLNYRRNSYELFNKIGFRIREHINRQNDRDFAISGKITVVG